MLEAGALFGEAGLVALHRAAPAGTSAADVRRLLAEQPGLLPPYPETVDAVSAAMPLPRPAPPRPAPPHRGPGLSGAQIVRAGSAHLMGRVTYVCLMGRVTYVC